MTAAKTPGPILPVLIGGVSDGEFLEVEPGLTEHRVARQLRGQPAPDHVYRLQTFELVVPDARRSGVTWPSVRAWVHEDVDLRHAAIRMLATLVGRSPS